MARPLPVWHVTLTDGKLSINEEGLFRRWLRSLKNGPLDMVFRRPRRPKSRSQLGYLWGVLYPVIAEACGYGRRDELDDALIDAIHDACITKLRGYRPEPNPLHVRAGLRDEDHEGTSEYIDDLRHWALTEHGIVTPDADKAVAR